MYLTVICTALLITIVILITHSVYICGWGLPSLNEAVDVAQNRPLCLCLLLCTRSGAWQKWMNVCMDCAVEVDGSVVNVVIGARVGECTARFWSGRSLSNYHMARRRGCLWVEPLPCRLHVYAGEPRLLHLRTAWLLPGIVTSSSSGLVSRYVMNSASPNFDTAN